MNRQPGTRHGARACPGRRNAQHHAAPRRDRVPVTGPVRYNRRPCHAPEDPGELTTFGGTA